MEPAHQIILESLSEKPYRSKLEPHRDLIRELRRSGRTYREVARLFHERLGLHVALSTLHSFVKVRAKHRKRTQFELPPMGLVAADSPVLERVAALKAKPAVREATSDREQLRDLLGISTARPSATELAREQEPPHPAPMLNIERPPSKTIEPSVLRKKDGRKHDLGMSR
jgi:hypothetical protein